MGDFLESDEYSIAQFKVSGSHFEIGRAIGARFADQIHQALDGYEFFQQRLLPYHRSEEGQRRYQKFVELNRSHYPDYFIELEGMAQGANRPLEDLVLLNLRGEYRDYFQQFVPHGCADCAVVTDDVAVIGHNEDGDPEFKDKLYLVRVDIPDKPTFTALSYPGFLCGNAFGFNSRGICVTVDNVRPLHNEPGLGRHFVARSLLEAISLQDAVQQATVSGQASGFHYTIGSTTERRVVSIETSPSGHTLREVRSYFHTNHYLEMDIDQVIDPSSQARSETGRKILESKPSPGTDDVLTILGNQSDLAYPIYGTRTCLNPLMTFCTCLFDLDQRLLRIYTTHPHQSPPEFIELAIG